MVTTSLVGFLVGLCFVFMFSFIIWIFYPCLEDYDLDYPYINKLACNWIFCPVCVVTSLV